MLLMWVTHVDIHADNLFRSKHSGLEYLCYSRTIPFANYLGAIISRFNSDMPENNTKLIQIGDVDDIGFTTTYQLSSKYHQQCWHSCVNPNMESRSFSEWVSPWFFHILLQFSAHQMTSFAIGCGYPPSLCLSFSCLTHISPLVNVFHN